ncbi:MAG: ATP/GTP-binding protein [Chromatiaceae bacterium]|nr:ATP/GTP-binding protein [Gammaproteobacteria bacterium]MCP5305747.1 ATP/GTP-binding protein [Chromatiaceae bacterium]MCP5312604.1 ATP/GTP-binding protein [Chromatiaceae bacterium]
MANYKIVFSGPVGAGKTTAIESLSEIPVVKTDASASDMTLSRKASTTVAMDYGILKLSNTERVHLYGTPGQQRFDFMWDILSEGALGLVLLIDNSREKPFADLDFYLGAFKEFIDTTGVVVGVTQMDKSSTPTLRDYAQHLGQQGRLLPVFEADARKQRDVSILVQVLLYSLDPGVHAHG